MTFYSTHRYRNYRRPFVSRDDRTIERVEAKLERAAESAATEDRQIGNDPSELQDAPPAPSASTKSGWPDPAELPDVTEHQREQYGLATAGNTSLGILGGRPGGGKSWTLARILKSIPTARAAVCALAGKAAVRASELLNRAGVNKRATTIHSMLKVVSSDDGWQFEYGEGNPLPYDFIAVDEVSMVDCKLMADLFAARAPGCKILLIGDVNQLSPVGHGAPLRDLIRVGLPYGEMRQIHRNSGRIIKACHAMIDNKTYEPSAKLDLEAESPENLLHVEVRDPEQQIEKLKGILERFRQGAQLATRGPDGAIVKRTISPVWDCQILAPLNEKSPLSRKKLNVIFQGFCNPGGEQIDGCRFRTGDKAVITKNRYFICETNIPRELEAEGPWNVGMNVKDRKIFACNGDLIRVMSIAKTHMICRLWYPNRLVKVFFGKPFEDEDGEENVSKCDVEPAWVMTPHKAQGSGYPVTLTLIDDAPGARMLCDNSWLYTATSRSEIMGISIGQRETAEAMCKRSHIWNRKTFLCEEIKQLSQAGLSRAWEEELGKL